MATASFIPPKPISQDVQLILTEEEACFIRDFVGNCVINGGSNNKSIASYVNSTWRALSNLLGPRGASVNIGRDSRNFEINGDWTPTRLGR